MLKLKIGIVGKYPPQGTKHTKFSGEYTKNLAISLSNWGGEPAEIIVFANRLKGEETNYYEEGIRVIRCWDSGVFFFSQIFREVRRVLPQIVHIQHELFYYGGVLTAFNFPLLLALISLLRIPRLVTAHGILSLSSINQAFMKQNRITGFPFLGKLSLFIIIRSIIGLATNIVVHEKFFRHILQVEYKYQGDKVKVIPLGIEQRDDAIDRKKAKKILTLSGKKIILFFGFITGYKGVELLIDSFEFLINKHPDYLLVIMGGEHPRMTGRFIYQEYLISLQERAKNIPKDQIIFTGFVSEEKIPLYFSAADVVVLPYTTAMSSSGPLTFAISYNRPFLVSEPLGKLIELKELVFKSNPRFLAEKIEEFLINRNLQEKALKYGQQLKEERIWGNVGKKTHELYDTIMNR